MKKFSFSGLNERTNKEQILAKVRNAVITKDENLFSDVNLQSDTWKPFTEEDGCEFTFIKRFKNNDGIFMYFENERNFIDALKQYIVENQWNPLFCTSPGIKTFLDANEAGIELCDDFSTECKKMTCITDCECLVAQTGSIVISDRCAGSNDAFSKADTLLIFAKPSQLVDGMKDAINYLKKKYQDDMPTETVFINGPSRSIEFDNQLVIGAQGIRQIALFFVDDEII
ncbi:MAG: lactate utilization protein [Bacteroidales bacterium]|nr:lactate utilization protein [Bacteroidales bacterium]